MQFDQTGLKSGPKCWKLKHSKHVKSAWRVINLLYEIIEHKTMSTIKMKKYMINWSITIITCDKTEVDSNIIKYINIKDYTELTPTR